MELIINQTLSNGTWQVLKDEHNLGFAMGALDRDWTVKMPGALVARRGKLELILPTMGKERNAVLFKGREILLTIPVGKFRWTDLNVLKGLVYYEGTYICSTR